MKQDKKIAIVYDWIDKWGGVERLLTVLHELYPQAPVYTSYANTKTAIWASKLRLKTSFMQHLPPLIRNSRILSFLFFPFAFESFDFSKYETVISVTSSFAKGIVTKTGTKHICILLTPTRYLWVYPADYLEGTIRKLLGWVIAYAKTWISMLHAGPIGLYQYPVKLPPDVKNTIQERVR
jgi:hypothetical protein